MLDPVTMVGARLLAQRALVSVQQLLDCGVANGVHTDLKASSMSIPDERVELFLGEIQIAAVTGLIDWLNRYRRPRPHWSEAEMRCQNSPGRTMGIP